MKKIIALCLILVMAVGFVACAKAPVEEAPAVESPLALLESVWALYGDEEKFALMGGNPEAGVMDAPGAFDMTYAEALASFLQLSAEQVAQVDEAATMIHMMNANTFTCGALRLTEGTDVTAYVEGVRESVQNAQWMCGFPETLLIANVGGLVVMAYGAADLIPVFEGHLTTAYTQAEILVNEAIAG